VTDAGADVGVDDIASVSGIAKPVFYRYFVDKSDLFLAVGRTVAETVVAHTTAAIDAQTSPRAMLEAGIDAYAASVEANPELYRFVAQTRVIAIPADSDVLGDYATVVGRHAARVIGDFRRQAGLDAGVAETWGFGIVGLVRSAVDRWLQQGRPLTRAELVTSLTDLVWPGLAQPGADSHPLAPTPGDDAHRRRSRRLR
jgi:AcrR family transcriptional regulator